MISPTTGSGVAVRERADRCPGVLRPWIAEDGGLVRIRLIGGEIPVAGLVALAAIADRYGVPGLHLTRRANLQLRGLPVVDGRLAPAVVDELLGTGLLPSPTHELVRNVMVSPLTGLDGGRADLGAVARELDRLVCSDPVLAALPGRFLFVLDDGRGDLVGRSLDLGLVAVGEDTAQLRAGTDQWGPVVDLAAAPGALVELARTFLSRRGSGRTAAWHVGELDGPLLDGVRDPRTGVSCAAAPYGRGREDGPGYEHRAVADGVLTPASLEAIVAGRHPDPVRVTPWHGLILLDS